MYLHNVIKTVDRANIMHEAKTHTKDFSSAHCLYHIMKVKIISFLIFSLYFLCSQSLQWQMKTVVIFNQHINTLTR